MRRIAMALLLALGATACGGGSSEPKAGGTPTDTPTSSCAAVVNVVDFHFKPKEVTIAAGECVQWDFTGAAPHTVTADDKKFDSGVLNKGAKFTHTFDAAGTFKYYCTLHGSKGGGGQAGTVTVT